MRQDVYYYYMYICISSPNFRIDLRDHYTNMYNIISEKTNARGIALEVNWFFGLFVCYMMLISHNVKPTNNRGFC